MKIDLLPARYHQVQAIERQLQVAMAILVGLGVVLSTSYIVVRAQIRAYELRSQYLHAVAGQYKVVNDTYVSMKATGAELTARKALLEPLIARRTSVLDVLDGLRRDFPAGVQLDAVRVPARDALSFSGTARDFESVGRFMKWLSDRKGCDEVTLTGADSTTGAGVTFVVTAQGWKGGETR